MRRNGMWLLTAVLALTPLASAFSFFLLRRERARAYGGAQHKEVLRGRRILGRCVSVSSRIVMPV
jgi:hypothetical protein